MVISKQSTLLDKEEEKKEKFNFAFFSSCFDTATIAAGKEVEKAAGGEPERMPPRRRTPLTRTVAWSRRKIGDRSWSRRWTTPPFDQTWRPQTTPGQRDATIKPWGMWTNHGKSTYPVRRSSKDEEEKDEIILVLLVPW